MHELKMFLDEITRRLDTTEEKMAKSADTTIETTKKNTVMSRQERDIEHSGIYEVVSVLFESQK